MEDTMPTYQHPDWWTPKLEREAQKAERKKWLKRCTTCGIIMRVDATRCGEWEEGHSQN
jgi:hypothetical protein